MTVASVSVNGNTLTKGTHYTVTGDGTTTPEVVFLPGNVPASGATVRITGTTARTGCFTGGLDW